ncbi:hypothetical protein FKM82_003372 [Ascaphus truei]
MKTLLTNALFILRPQRIVILSFISRETKIITKALLLVWLYCFKEANSINLRGGGQLYGIVPLGENNWMAWNGNRTVFRWKPKIWTAGKR